MAWSDADGVLTLLMGPSITAILVTLAVVLFVPVVLHHFFFSSGASKARPEFLLLGPSGSGKTTLLTYFKTGSPAATHSSQTPQTVDALLPIHIVPASKQFREVNDPVMKVPEPFAITDTPGHGKLRYFALDRLRKPEGIRGVIFLVDVAAFGGNEGLREAAEYLYEVLLILQRRVTSAKNPKKIKPISVLIAANKQDLFTALPTAHAQAALEREISDIRSARDKGLLDSAISAADADMVEEKEWLGDTSKDKFEFGDMEEFDIAVSVEGGHVLGSGHDVDRWWTWIGRHI